MEEATMTADDLIVVTGATGRQGGAVARHLLADGWRVRALTRSPGSPAAQGLATHGVEVIRADLGDVEALARAFAEARGVFSVQNAMIAGEEGEVAQGRNVATAAARAGVSHLVQGSAGPGTPGTGVAAWDGKVGLAAYARGLGLPLTVLRPMAFMELMTDKDLYPPVAMWYLMPRTVGEDRPLPWLSADDLGAIAARAFADPATFVGLDVGLAADVRTIAQCRASWRAVTGRDPRRLPMPVWLFERFVGCDLMRMWRWLAVHEVVANVDRTRSLLPTAATVDGFLRRRLA
jgi:uncharacterized protein YbjT (DUF2867 family)